MFNLQTAEQNCCNQTLKYPVSKSVDFAPLNMILKSILKKEF